MKKKSEQAKTKWEIEYTVGDQRECSKEYLNPDVHLKGIYCGTKEEMVVKGKLHSRAISEKSAVHFEMSEQVIFYVPKFKWSKNF